MSEPSHSSQLLQKRLRFLLRAYVACWVIVYFAFKRQTIVVDLYLHLAQIDALAWMRPMVFVWIAGTLIFAPIAAVYWRLTRPPAPEPSWREMDIED